MIDCRFVVRLARAVALSLVCGLPAALAQGEAQRPLSALVKDWQKTLDDIEKELAKAEPSDARLAALSEQLGSLYAAAQAAAEAAQPQLKALRDDLAALGQAPPAGAPPEAPNIVAQRKQLNERLAAVEGAIKEDELVIARAGRLAADLKTLRRERFTERILARGQSPLSPAVWRKAGTDLAAAWQQLYGDVAAGLSREVAADGALATGRQLLVSLVLALLLAFPLRSRLIQKFGYLSLEGEPTYLQRLWAAAFTGIVRALLPSMAAGALYLGLSYGEDLTGPWLGVAQTALLALVGLFFVAGFCHSALAPYEPGWRLVPIHDDGARAVSRAVTGLAGLFALDQVVTELAGQYDASVELLLVQKFAFGLAISALLLTLLRRRVWFAEPGAELDVRWQRLRYFLALLVAAIPLSAVLGYVVLSRLLATQLVLTVGLYAAVLLLRKVAREAVEHALSDSTPMGGRLRAAFGLSSDGAEILKFWAGVAAELVILAVGTLVLLVLWGVSERDLIGGLRSAFFGFKVGNITISLAEVLWALVLFVILLAVTRMLQKTLDQRVFPRTRLDIGLRHSVRSAVGYAGFAVAAMAAISTLGINLSNLAIIAGALSVGIGFGLQNIVNNFVSGLILLVERPIKVGDWVVVGEHQGYVKKISVRATEVTTFDRASVFIPNSSLIAGAVMNRTHADKVGRVLLPVGISYEDDPNRARQVLTEVALAHPEVRRNPAPSVLFRGFGERTMNFELIAFVHDVDKVLSVTSDLFFAIHAAFQREGIRIPHIQ
ncbi:DUF3772 domain-containing protein [Candidatus Methylocalor cossyra]|uniref:Potassium efflux system KefA protein / Small-conductance mechanosensitive channel n=1 Tax=Candidatus Methylocalor cossyra TaxID=3108543 RepID=A0ABM9NHF0_9GAMM